jgi:WD repeat-containing protein 19
MIDSHYSDHDLERELSESGNLRQKRESAIIDNRGQMSLIRITSDLLISASEKGTIEFFHFDDWAVVNLYRHSDGIKFIETDALGLRVAAIDDQNRMFIYNAVTDVVVDVLTDDLPTSPSSILWDKSSVTCNVFIATDGRNVYVHSFVKETIKGAKTELVGTCKVPASQSPLLLHDGNVICQTTSGARADFTLSTHEKVHPATEISVLKREILPSILKLRRFGDAIRIGERINDPESWNEVVRTAIYDMNLDVAILVCSKIPDFGMSRSLKRLRSEIEERSLLMAHLAVCLQMYDLAQELFLKSSQPDEALTMRQNIQDWETALILAKRLSPASIPTISREYASQLELAGDYEAALVHFEKAMINSSERGMSEEAGSAPDSGAGEPQTWDESQKQRHDDSCLAGIARNAIRTGNTHRGLKCALKLKSNREVQMECARICESMKLLSDAAILYETAHEYEKAALLYIQVKNVAKVSQFIDHISQSEPLIEYARMQEQARRFKEAITAYKKAGQEEQVIRVLLDEIKNPAEAIKIVRDSKSVQGAKMIAKFFQKINDMSSAIEFLVLSRCTEEAFQLASSTGQMDAYANILLSVSGDMESPPLSDFHSIALFYEQDRNPLMAGKFYCLSQNYRKGVKLLLSAITESPSVEAEAFQLAIDAAAKSQEDAVVHRLVDFLVGDVDGFPRDFKYLFRLYMKLGHYKEAAKTAIAIAREEQSSGNYRNAHSLLLDMSRELKKHDIRIPSEMTSSLLLLHSYLLAKVLIHIPLY